MSVAFRAGVETEGPRGSDGRLAAEVWRSMRHCSRGSRVGAAGLVGGGRRLRRARLRGQKSARVTSRMASCWRARHGYRPVLVETFVDPSRFGGACYRAANWRFLGETRGKGSARTPKGVFVYPLDKDFRAILTDGRRPAPRRKRPGASLEGTSAVRGGQLEAKPAAVAARGRLPVAAGQRPLPAGPAQLPVPAAFEDPGGCRPGRAGRRKEGRAAWVSADSSPRRASVARCGQCDSAHRTAPRWLVRRVRTSTGRCEIRRQWRL